MTASAVPLPLRRNGAAPLLPPPPVALLPLPAPVAPLHLPPPSRFVHTALHRRVLDGGKSATTTTLTSPLPIGLDGGATGRAILLSFSHLPPSRRRAPEDGAPG
ncbi:Os08g0330800 [Oryza sativa Japonica Group]|uniref:Os08g0330800 protein n=2 Tax=Oryza sativa subsp. japonica TaxID=39947 RepID=Q0J6E0_ORYSJ|nr:Os08g0330800 [Oryza sativa Japonica Group]BAG98083.1 unnamed protein product [Oryza sativa Japonica Group]BAT04930.1 Os08g0330800 [Oryza sativa Japonica Group]|eukprot:NP_001061561.1 Os08g0330800 [Oryza sativa Japonica Group]